MTRVRPSCPAPASASSTGQSHAAIIYDEMCREQGQERNISLLVGGSGERGNTGAVNRHIEALEAAEANPRSGFPFHFRNSTR